MTAMRGAARFLIACRAAAAIIGPVGKENALELEAPREAGSAAGIWRLAAAGLGAILVGLGLARFAYTPLIPALIEAHWFSPAEAAYLGATNLAGYFLGALLVRRITLHATPPTVIRGAMVAAAASFFACAWPTGFLWFFPWRLLSGIVGGLLMVLAVSTVLARAPARRRGLVSGILFTGVGLGIIAAGQIVPVLARQGLTTVWLALGAVTALVTLLTWRSWPPEPRTAAVSAAPGRIPAKLALGPIAILLVAYACDAIGFIPHSLFWIDYIARGLGHGLSAGGGYWAAFGVGAAVGPLLAGFLADRIGIAHSLVLALFVKGLAVALPILCNGPLCLVLSSLFVGALTPGVPSIISGRVVELAPTAQHRQAWALMTTVFAVAQAVGGYGLSFLFAWTGSYHLLFAVGSVSLGLATVLALLSARQRRN
jgi:predicted MFS family arabinose efflux permease